MTLREVKGNQSQISRISAESTVRRATAAERTAGSRQGEFIWTHGTGRDHRDCIIIDHVVSGRLIYSAVQIPARFLHRSQTHSHR